MFKELIEQAAKNNPDVIVGIYTSILSGDKPLTFGVPFKYLSFIENNGNCLIQITSVHNVHIIRESQVTGVVFWRNQIE